MSNKTLNYRFTRIGPKNTNVHANSLSLLRFHLNCSLGNSVKIPTSQASLREMLKSPAGKSTTNLRLKVVHTVLRAKELAQEQTQ